MEFLKKVNEKRRLVLRYLTKNVGSSHLLSKRGKRVGVEIKKILISRPNARLGNLLLITPLIREVVAAFPDCEIDLFVKGNAAPEIFRNYENVNRIIQLPGKPFKNLGKYLWQWGALRKYRYDLVLNVDKNSSSGRLSSLFAHADFKIFGEIEHTTELKHPDFRHIAKQPVYSFRKNMAVLGIGSSESAVPSLDIKLDPQELHSGKETLLELTGNTKKTICIFTYATGSKCYPKNWWHLFYDKLRAAYPEFNIIEMLPIHNASQIDFRAPAFYSKKLLEIASVLANVEVFIGADSGMMHLASASGTSVAGLFSVSDIEKYRPYNQNSIAIDTNSGGLDSWLDRIDGFIRTAGMQGSAEEHSKAVG